MPGGGFEPRRRCMSTADVVECATASRDKSRSRPYTHRMPPCGQPLAAACIPVSGIRDHRPLALLVASASVVVHVVAQVRLVAPAWHGDRRCRLGRSAHPCHRKHVGHRGRRRPVPLSVNRRPLTIFGNSDWPVWKRRVATLARIPEARIPEAGTPEAGARSLSLPFRKSLFS